MQEKGILLLDEKVQKASRRTRSRTFSYAQYIEILRVGT
jgi:hypothetical protein